MNFSSPQQETEVGNAQADVEDQSISNDVRKKSIDLLGMKDNPTAIGNFWDVLSFGICLVAANVFIAWSSALANSYYDFLIATILVNSTFICLHLCVAEMVSILPFSGGTYGFARVTVGPYIGFLVGAFESIANIVYTFVGMMPIGTSITYIFNGNPDLEPLYWFLAYVTVIGMEFMGRRFYFKFLNAYAFAIIMIVIFYLILACETVDVDRYLPPVKDNLFRNGMTDLMSIWPIVGWFYLGFETMPLISDEIQRAPIQTPRGILWTLAFLCVCSFVVVICAYAQSPGYLDDYITEYLPLNSGFSNALGISDHMATIISLPALYISNAIYIFGYGKQMSALAHSKLLPSMLGWTLPHSKIPYVSLIVGSLFGMVVLVILVKGYGYTYFSSAINNCFNSALMGSYFTFMVMFVSFIIFRRKYPNLKRGYTNPLGMYGAIYGIISLSFMFAALIGWSNDDYGAVKYFACFIGICSVYYFGYAKYRQIFSEREQDVLFVVYLMKANEKRNKMIRSKTSAGNRRSLRSRDSRQNAPLSESDPPVTTGRRDSSEETSVSILLKNIARKVLQSPVDRAHWQQSHQVHPEGPLSPALEGHEEHEDRSSVGELLSV